MSPWWKPGSWCCAGRIETQRGEPLHRSTIPDLWRVTDALARITEILTINPKGAELVTFLPPIAQGDSNLTREARTAVANTLLGGLELAREGALTMTQEEPMAECWIRAGC
jgi:segregation and condensation protein A